MGGRVTKRPRGGSQPRFPLINVLLHGSLFHGEPLTYEAGYSGILKNWNAKVERDSISMME